MAKKFKYLRLSALYHLMDGLSFDVVACADVLEVALAQMNLQTGVPDSIVQWNRRGGHAGGPLKLAGQGGIAIEVSETYSLKQGKMHSALVLKNKEDGRRPPVVFLTMRSIALDIPSMRVEIPLRVDHPLGQGTGMEIGVEAAHVLRSRHRGRHRPTRPDPGRHGASVR
jgi:hypothetical protein